LVIKKLEKEAKHQSILQKKVPADHFDRQRVQPYIDWVVKNGAVINKVKVKQVSEK